MGSALTKTPSSSSADEFAMESHECRRLPMTSPSYPETTQHRFRFVREEKYHQDTWSHHLSYYQKVSTGTWLDVLNSYTIECTVFTEPSTVIEFLVLCLYNRI